LDGLYQQPLPFHVRQHGCLFAKQLRNQNAEGAVRKVKMRVLVAGGGSPAKALRGQLAQHNFHHTSYRPHLTVRVEEEAGATNITVIFD
jgi:hypothetical protein